MQLSKFTKVNIGWAAVVVGGIGSFWFAKQSIDKTRIEAMRTRERIRKASTEGK